MSNWAALRRHAGLRWGFLIGLVFVVIVAARPLALFEPLELLSYDGLIWLRATITPTRDEAPIVRVSATEEDLNRWGWPLSDAVLAEVIDRLAAAGPRAIGIDLYRDAPRPPGEAQLREALVRHANVIVAFKFDGGGETAIPPPEALRGTDRAGFA